MSRALYNEIDPAAAHTLRHLIAEGVIAPGDVAECSIKDLTVNDLRGYTQIHFFAGIGAWSVAARLAGWSDDRPLWTGSCPCQPFSAAGKGQGRDDPRHLWPDFHRLISAARDAGLAPPAIVGEQVAGKAGYDWFDGVRADLAREGFAGRVVDFPACSIDAPHQRNRLYWVAVERATSIGRGEGRAEHELRGGRSTLAGADASGVTLGDAFGPRLEGHAGHGDRSRRPEPRRSVTATDGGERDLLARANGGRKEGRSVLRSGKGESEDREWSYGQSGGSGRGERRDVADSTSSGWNAASYGGIHREAQGERPWHGEPERLPRTDGGQGVHADANVMRELQQKRRVSDEWGRARDSYDFIPYRPNGTYWSDAEWIVCHDEKARRSKPGLRFLVDGLPGRIDLWRLGGNAIVPQAAAEVLAALREVLDIEGLKERNAA